MSDLPSREIDPHIARRQQQIADRLARDSVLRDQIQDVIDAGTWAHDGFGLVTVTLAIGNGNSRLIEFEGREMRLGSTAFPERKRIPLD